MQPQEGLEVVSGFRRVVNAICHRDYTIAGGAVHVAMYDDRLEIISSGLLPGGRGPKLGDST